MEKAMEISKLISRKTIKLMRDSSRVITRAHIPGGLSRIDHIIDRVLKLSEEETEKLMHTICDKFNDRHKDIERQITEHFDNVSEFLPHDITISKMKKELIGAYFTMEYSIESAALFNPSMIPHPDQSNLPEGCLRFIMSLRATGEGHISSIVFRSGIINKDDSILFDPISEFVETSKMRHNPFYDSHLFRLKLEDLNAWDETSIRVMEQIPDRFTFQELKVSIGVVHMDPDFSCNDDVINTLFWLANSNYNIQFDKSCGVSERVIFPYSENENRGIEDARFVQFLNDTDESIYYATYTAYNGVSILPQLIETKDFLNFNVITLNGKAVQNKGMALFPRKIKGRYVMLSRQDGENNHIMFSDHLHFWQESKIIQEPTKPWEFIQIGNCGSPIETKEGWLVLTHGVGPMRQYSIGAILLDLDDPTKVIAQLEEPLLTPNEEEREGYVPNVIYSCGGLLRNHKLIIPYAMSDISSGIATIDLNDLLSCMKFHKQEDKT
ncbi:glycoside hydrolase family 130 protein [Labilibaculum euxinus]|uniref:glycoside hydrolase family 130 protein n=1 Tax=Labilibaculum euxinus TaxID=2686357 RepID=UPI001CDBDC90|nr:glycoside hydrolase family 130 protein [Labilibaculum euxinus]MDQ1771707.1 glycoside hydrolase family 130 protein [Labilibaculum euxinus]